MTAKLALYILLVFLGLLIGIKTLADIGDNRLAKKRDLLFMTDQRLTALVFEINNFPRGPGQDVLFLKNLNSLKKFSELGNGRETAKEAVRDLRSYLDQSDVFYSIAYVDLRSGDAIYLTQSGDPDFGKMPDLPEMNRKSIEAAETLPENKVYLSDAYETSDPGRNIVMDYATPVYSEKTGSLIGIVSLSVSINYLLEDIRSYSKPGEDVFLINAAGYYLANKDASKEFLADSNRKGGFLEDYPEIAETVLTTDERRVENADYVFSIKHIYPTSCSFEFFNDKQAGSDYPHHWMLVSVLKKESGSPKVVDNYYYLAAVIMLIILSALIIGKSKDFNKKILVFLFLFAMFIPVAKARAMTVDVNIPEKYKSVEAGDRLYFQLDIQYPENQMRRDVRVEYDLVKSGELILKSKNLKAIESQTSFMDYIVVPEFAGKGEYAIKVIVTDGVVGEGSGNFIVTSKGDSIKLVFYAIIGLILVLSVIIGWETIRLGKLEKK